MGSILDDANAHLSTYTIGEIIGTLGLDDAPAHATYPIGEVVSGMGTASAALVAAPTAGRGVLLLDAGSNCLGGGSDFDASGFATIDR